MNDDRDFVLHLERWLENRDAPVSASRLSEDVLAAVASIPQEGRLIGPLRRRITPAPFRMLALAAALVLALSGVTAVYIGGRPAIVNPPPSAPTPALTASPMPADPFPDLLNRIPLSAESWQVLATGERTWVQIGTVGLAAIDPKTGEQVAYVPNATWMFLEGDDLWAQNGVEDVLMRLDPVTGEERERFLNIPGNFAAKDDETVWSLVAEPTSQVIRTDLVTGERLAAIDVPEGPKRVAFADGSIWIGSLEGNELVRIDPDTYEIVDTVDVGVGPVEIELAFGSLWVRNAERQLVRVDPVTATVVATIDGFTNYPANALTVGGGFVWASWDVPPGMAAIDPATNEVVRTIPLPPARFHDSFWLDDTLWVSTTNRDLLEVDTGPP